MWIAALGACTAAAAAPREDPEEPHEVAVMVSPIGPVVSVVATATGTPTFDLTPRVHQSVTEGIGWTVQADLTHAAVFDMKVSYLGLRGGPRFSLRKRGLSDWTVTPFVLVGVSTLSALDARLARYGMVGAGVEGGRTWVLNRFVMELGLGVYAATPVGYSSPAELFEDARPKQIFPIKPSITASVGYAF